MADIVRTGEATGGPLNPGVLPSNNDLVMYRGDDFELLITVRENGTPITTAGTTPSAHLKSDYNDYAPKVFTCTATGVPGQYRMALPGATTATLIPGSYIYDFQVRKADGSVRTYLTGDVTVYNEVTDA